MGTEDTVKDKLTWGRPQSSFWLWEHPQLIPTSSWPSLPFQRGKVCSKFHVFVDVCESQVQFIFHDPLLCSPWRGRWVCEHCTVLIRRKQTVAGKGLISHSLLQNHSLALGLATLKVTQALEGIQGLTQVHNSSPLHGSLWPYFSDLQTLLSCRYRNDFSCDI